MGKADAPPCNAPAFSRKSTLIMTFNRLLCSLALAPSLLLGAAPFALAASADYEFEIIQSHFLMGAGAILTLAVTDLRTQVPVTTADIFATRLDMAPDGMAKMTTPVELLASGVPGQYRFQANLTMAGAWRFSIAAHLEGEPEVIRREVILQVAP